MANTDVDALVASTIAAFLFGFLFIQGTTDGPVFGLEIPEAAGILCSNPNYDGEEPCIDPDTPACTENTYEVCYNDQEELENVGCYDVGYRDGRDSGFDMEVYNDNCGSTENAEDNQYYQGFIEGCMSVEGNTERVCEQATDAGD